MSQKIIKTRNNVKQESQAQHTKKKSPQPKANNILLRSHIFFPSDSLEIKPKTMLERFWDFPRVIVSFTLCLTWAHRSSALNNEKKTKKTFLPSR